MLRLRVADQLIAECLDAQRFDLLPDGAPDLLVQGPVIADADDHVPGLQRRQRAVPLLTVVLSSPGGRRLRVGTSGADRLRHLAEQVRFRHPEVVPIRDLESDAGARAGRGARHLLRLIDQAGRPGHHKRPPGSPLIFNRGGIDPQPAGHVEAAVHRIGRGAALPFLIVVVAIAGQPFHQPQRESGALAQEQRLVLLRVVCPVLRVQVRHHLPHQARKPLFCLALRLAAIHHADDRLLLVIVVAIVRRVLRRVQERSGKRHYLLQHRFHLLVPRILLEEFFQHALVFDRVEDDLRVLEDHADQTREIGVAQRVNVLADIQILQRL